MDAGAKVNVENNAKQRPLDVAKMNGEVGDDGGGVCARAVCVCEGSENRGDWILPWTAIATMGC